jgi:hypothetical protein
MMFLFANSCSQLLKDDLTILGKYLMEKNVEWGMSCNFTFSIFKCYQIKCANIDVSLWTHKHTMKKHSFLLIHLSNFTCHFSPQMYFLWKMTFHGSKNGSKYKNKYVRFFFFIMSDIILCYFFTRCVI